MAAKCITSKTKLDGVNICFDDVSIYSNAKYGVFRQLSSNYTPIDSNMNQYDAIHAQSIESYLAGGTAWSKINM